MLPLHTGLLGDGRDIVQRASQSMPPLQNVVKSPDDDSQFFTCIALCNLPYSLKMIPISKLQELRHGGVSQPGPGQQGLSCRGSAQSWEHLVYPQDPLEGSPTRAHHAVDGAHSGRISEAWEMRAPGACQQYSVWHLPSEPRRVQALGGAQQQRVLGTNTLGNCFTWALLGGS